MQDSKIVDLERAHKAASALNQMFGGKLQLDPESCKDVLELKQVGAVLWDRLEVVEKESLCHLALAFIQGVQSREIVVTIKGWNKNIISLGDLEKTLALHGAMAAVPMLTCLLAFRQED